MLWFLAAIILFIIIKSLIEKSKQLVKDHAATVVLKDFNIIKEKQEIDDLIKGMNFQSKVPTSELNENKKTISKSTQYAQKQKNRLTFIQENDSKCPKCEGKGILKIRKGKYGRFIGCSNYPACKFTKS